MTKEKIQNIAKEIWLACYCYGDYDKLKTELERKIARLSENNLMTIANETCELLSIEKRGNRQTIYSILISKKV